MSPLTTARFRLLRSSSRPKTGSSAKVVKLDRAQAPTPRTQFLWPAIRAATESISWKRYQPFIDEIMCRQLTPSSLTPDELSVIGGRPRSMPFPGADAYALLKTATEIFLM